MDIEVLINEVNLCVPIWDSSHPKHSDRNYVAQQWKRIANKLEVTEEKVRKKFKGLRDTFRQELKKVSTVKTDHEDSNVTMQDCLSTWAHFESMYFLKDQIISRRCKENLTATGTHAAETLAPVTSEEESPATTNEENKSVDVEATRTRSSIERLRSASNRSFLTPKKRRVRNNVSSLRQQLLETKRQRVILSSKAYDNEADDLKLFLLSLIPQIKKLPPYKQSLLRLKFQEVVHNFAYNTPEQPVLVKVQCNTPSGSVASSPYEQKTAQPPSPSGTAFNDNTTKPSVD